MKFIRVIRAIYLPLCLALAGAAAHALPNAEIVCYSKAVADAGFSLRIEGLRERGVLEEESFAGPRFLANLRCEKLTPAPNPNPEVMQNTLLCRNKPRGEGGYVVRLFEGGNPIHQEARVLMATMVDGAEVETLVEWGELRCLLPR